MQTRSLSSLLAAFIAIVLFASCSSKTNKAGVSIPKNAAFVLHLNGESLSAKLPWEEVKKADFFREASSDTSVSAYLKAALDNPDNTGIDVKKDIIVFVQKDSLGGYVSIQGTVKDEAKFKEFSVNAAKGAAATEKDGISFVTKERTTTSWKKEKFIIVIDAPEMNELNKAKYSYDDPTPAAPTSNRDGVAAATALYNLKEDNSLAKDEKFSDLLSTKGDIHFWFNGEAFGAGNPALSALGMMNLSKLTEGSITAATANFENGKIVADFKSYSGKELSEIWKKYSGDKISSDMAKRIPSKDVAAFFALNFKPEGIREVLKLAGMEGWANMGAAQVGFTMDDFIKANKGDILFSVTDIRNDSITGKDANFLFATSIGDKASFGKLVDAGKKIGGMSMGSDPKVFFNSNDNYFAIGNNKAGIDNYIAGSNSKAFDLFDQIAGGPVGGYVNFQYILNSMKDDGRRDSLDNEIFAASLKMWDNLLAKGGEFKDGAMVQHIEVNLIDKNTNSLKQLNSYLGVVSAIEKKKKEIRDKEWGDLQTIEPMIDTTATIMAPAH